MTELSKGTAVTDIQTNVAGDKKLYEAYYKSVNSLFDHLEFKNAITGIPSILVKPNLVNASPFPVTTSVILCEVIIDLIRTYTSSEIVIAEGCGDMAMETDEVFNILGYQELSLRKNIKLIWDFHNKLEENASIQQWLKVHMRPTLANAL